jgi:hypothetical protein
MIVECLFVLPPMASSARCLLRNDSSGIIADMDQTSEAIFSLRPVNFHYREELDPTKMAQFGLIAEEVGQINPDLVARDDKGEIYPVRFDAVNAILLSESQKEHRTVEEQGAIIAQMKNK